MSTTPAAATDSASAENIAAAETESARALTMTTTGDYVGALAVIDRAERLAPNHTLTLPDGSTVGWDDMRACVRTLMGQGAAPATTDAGTAPVGVPEPAAVAGMPEPVPAEVTTAAASPVVEPAPAVTEPNPRPAVTAASLAPLVLRHTVADGTLLLGTASGTPAARVMGRYGQKWSFSPRIGDDGAWYIPGGRGKPADMERIDRAAAALRDAGYVVTVQVEETPAPATVTAPPAAEPAASSSEPTTPDMAEFHPAAAALRDAGRLVLVHVTDTPGTASAEAAEVARDAALPEVAPELATPAVTQPASPAPAPAASPVADIVAAVMSTLMPAITATVEAAMGAALAHVDAAATPATSASVEAPAGVPADVSTIAAVYATAPRLTVVPAPVSAPPASMAPGEGQQYEVPRGVPMQGTARRLRQAIGPRGGIPALLGVRAHVECNRPDRLLMVTVESGGSAEAWAAIDAVAAQVIGAAAPVAA